MQFVLADSSTTKAGRPLWWVAGFSLSLLLIVGTLAWVVARPDTYVVPKRETTTNAVEPALAARALQEFAEAIDQADGEAAAALAPADDAVTAKLLRAVAENSSSLRVGDFALRYVDEVGAVNADGSWQAAVDTTWRFDGFDPKPARAEVLFGFVAQDGRVALSSIGGGDRRTPIWMTGPVQVRRTAQTLVLAVGSSELATQYARRAEAAIPIVRRVLTRWRPRLVVEVPASAAALDQALDVPSGEYANIAAVTTSVDGRIDPGTPVHVFVNPDVFGRLGPQGAQVVMSHEATHIATDATSSAMPLWLLEGFADYVALRDVPLPISTTAGQIIAQVRRDGVPPALPGAPEFDTSTSRLGSAYESAWLACRVLADRSGAKALVRFYDQVDDDTDVGAALRAGFGLSLGQFTRAWQERLSDLAA